MARQLKYRLIYKFGIYLFILLSFIPIIISFETALNSKNSINIIKDVFNNHLGLLLKNILLATITGIIATLLGTSLAFILYKTDFSKKTWLKIIILTPLFISPYIWAVAWKDLFYLLFHNSHFMTNFWGVIWVQSLIFTPLAMLITGSAFLQINAPLEEAGLLVSKPKTVLFKIILPLIKPAIFTAFVLIFIFSLSDFSIAAFYNVKVFTVEIFTQFSAFYKHDLAIIQSSVLILISLALLWSVRKQLTQAHFLSVGTTGSYNKIYNTNRYSKWVWTVIIIWLIINIIAPLSVLFIQTFKDGFLSFKQAYKILQPTFMSSIGLAIIGSFFTLVIGFMVASQKWPIRLRSNKQRLLDTILLFLFVIPSIIYGIALIHFYNRPWLNFIYGSWILIIIAYVGKFSFIATKMIENALKQTPYSLYEIAKIEGVSKFNRWRQIILPLIAPAVFMAFLINFIFMLGELGTNIMIYPPGTELMPIKVFTMMANAPMSLTAAMSLIVFLVTLLSIILLYSLYSIIYLKTSHDKALS